MGRLWGREWGHPQVAGLGERLYLCFRSGRARVAGAEGGAVLWRAEGMQGSKWDPLTSGTA